jgi:hypothetical protein
MHAVLNNFLVEKLSWGHLASALKIYLFRADENEIFKPYWASSLQTDASMVSSALFNPLHYDNDL